MTYEWRFVDTERDMPARARERGEMTAYERRRLVSGEQIAAIRGANQPYWLRSSGTQAPPVARAPHSNGSAQSSSARRSLLTASSALLSPSLPPYRYLPGHPFVHLTELQLADCSTERKLQVSHFPALSVSRLPDGGWQMLNQYVLLRSASQDDDTTQQHTADAADDESDADEEHDDEDVDEEGTEGSEDDEAEAGEASGSDDEGRLSHNGSAGEAESDGDLVDADQAQHQHQPAALPSDDDEQMQGNEQQPDS